MGKQWGKGPQTRPKDGQKREGLHTVDRRVIVLFNLWRAEGLKGPEVLRKTCSDAVFELMGTENEQGLWDLASRIIDGWYSAPGAIVHLVEDLMGVSAEDLSVYTRLIETSAGCAFLQCLMKKMTDHISRGSTNWLETRRGVDYLFCLAMNNDANRIRARQLAFACAVYLPKLSIKEAVNVLPKNDIFRNWYATGVLEQSGKAWSAFGILEHMNEISQGKFGTDQWTAKAILDTLKATLLTLLELPLGASLEVEKSIAELTTKLSTKWPSDSVETFDQWLRKNMPDHRIGESE
jgi:hypothetical protein